VVCFFLGLIQMQKMPLDAIRCVAAASSHVLVDVGLGATRTLNKAKYALMQLVLSKIRTVHGVKMIKTA
jgi:hypothetical protein